MCGSFAIRQSDFWKKKRQQKKKNPPSLRREENTHIKKNSKCHFTICYLHPQNTRNLRGRKLCYHYQYTSPFPPSPFGRGGPKYYEWKQKEMKQAPSSRVKNSFRCKSSYYSTGARPELDLFPTWHAVMRGWIQTQNSPNFRCLLRASSFELRAPGTRDPTRSILSMERGFKT